MSEETKKTMAEKLEQFVKDLKEKNTDSAINLFKEVLGESVDGVVAEMKKDVLKKSGFIVEEEEEEDKEDKEEPEDDDEKEDEE